MANAELAVPEDQIELAILGEASDIPIMEDPEALSREIAARILSAESMDDVFSQGEVIHAKDVLGLPLLINGVRWQKSRYNEAGPQVYALIDATGPTGDDDMLITCGSRNVMAQLFWCWKRGQFPLPEPMMLVENETASGFGALWMQKYKGKTQ